MTCDSNLFDPKLFCDESPKYYYLNSILYAQRKEVINDFNDNEKRFSNAGNTGETVTKSRFQSISPTIILPINTTKLTNVAIRPFWGFNAMHSKLNETKEPLLMMSTMSPPTNQTVTPTWFTEALQNSYQHQNLKGAQNPQNNYVVNRLTLKTLNDFMKPSYLEPVNGVKFTTEAPHLPKGHTDWDDIETGDKLYKTQSNIEEFKPVFKEPFIPDKGLNTANTISLPLAGLSLKSGPVVVLRPSHFPGTLPITTVYKQTEYMFGKPRVVKKGLYLNPTFGAAILNPHSLIGSIAPIGLHTSASENIYTSVAHNQNSNIISNLQNALTKIPFSDILGLKQVKPNQKRSDSTIPKHISQTTTTFNPKWSSSILSKLYLSPNKPQTKSNILFNSLANDFYFPTKSETIVFPNRRSIMSNESNDHLINKEFQEFHFKNPELVKKSSGPLSGYSFRMEDTIKTENLMQPSIFYGVNNTKIRNKWFKSKINESDSQIKQINPQNTEYKSDEIKNSLNISSNNDTTNITKPLYEPVADKIIFFRL
jgi:hypothetical protein